MRLITVALFLVVGLSFGGEVGTAPSDLAMHDLEGNKVRLRDYRGKIVVLNFWATWCGPCREEMPMIGEAQRVWGPKGVVFVGVSLDEKDTRGNIPKFMRAAGADLAVWVGGSADTLDKLRLGNGVPDTVFVDERGVVMARVMGEIKRSELEERLVWLTGERRSPAPEPLVNHMPERE